MLANLLLTFVLGGLWHGAAWTFVCWGALHGVGLCVVRLWRRTGWRLPGPAAWGLTFAFVVVAWVFFRAHSLTDAWAMVRAMAGSAPAGAGWAAIGSLIDANAAASASLGAGLLIVFGHRNSNALAASFAGSWVAAGATAAALTLAMLQLANVAPFLYFNF